MDPYLESPSFWRTFHQLLVATMTAELNRTLPPGFAATIDERLYIFWPGRSIYPDTAILRRPDTPLAPSRSPATAVADPPLLLTVLEEEAHEPFIEIRTTHGDREVVTIIEVLSPANKAAGSPGREEYTRKQRELRGGDVHLLEIDLLRTGQHTVAVPEATLRQGASDWDYVVCLRRAERPNNYAVWPFTVRDDFPHVEIPLTVEHPDVLLNLQTVMNHAYDDGPFARLVDYSREPEPPFTPTNVIWADSLLRTKGLRT
jgi:hypothetical protein